MVGFLAEKFTFFNSLVTTKMSRSLRLSVYIDVVLLTNFPEQSEFYASTSNIPEVIQFYILVDKTFETDFNINRSTSNYLTSKFRYRNIIWQNVKFITCEEVT